MVVARLSSTYDHFLDDIVNKMTPEQILAFQLSEAEQDYIDDLTERNNEGQLSTQEKAELQYFAEIERTMSLLKAKADHMLSQK